MSYINKNLSDKSEGRSSQLVIISKNRLSSARNKENYLTIQDGNKVYKKLIKGNLSRQDINQTISSIKNEMVRNSKSYMTLNYKEANKLDLYLKKKKILIKDEKKLNISNSETKINNNKINIPSSQLKSILSIETTKSGNIIKTTDNLNDIDGQMKAKESEVNGIKKNDKENIFDDDDVKNISQELIEIKDENNNKNSNNNNLIEDNLVNLEKK